VADNKPDGDKLVQRQAEEHGARYLALRSTVDTAEPSTPQRPTFQRRYGGFWSVTPTSCSL